MRAAQRLPVAPMVTLPHTAGWPSPCAAPHRRRWASLQVARAAERGAWGAACCRRRAPRSSSRPAPLDLTP